MKKHKIEVEVRKTIPEGEIWFFYGYRLVGKIVNLWEEPATPTDTPANKDGGEKQ